jgi:Bacterial dnaA protein helix-turn-helix
MSLAHDWRREAIERRNRMRMAGLQRRADEVRLKLVKNEPIEKPLYEIPNINRTPDELLNCRPYVRKYPTVNEIVAAVSDRFGVSVSDIMSMRRTNEIIFARHACYWLVREVTPLSLLQIARFMDKKDHSTIIHGIEMTEKRIAARFPVDVADNCLSLRDTLNGPQMKPYWGC